MHLLSDQHPARTVSRSRISLKRRILPRLSKEVVLWTKETGSQLGEMIYCAAAGTPAKILGVDGVPHSLIQVSTGRPRWGEVEASSAAFEGQPGQAVYLPKKGVLANMILPMTRDLERFGVVWSPFHLERSSRR
ncbi:hypothetical protein V8E53_005202 [Lactarius tabidus]